MPRIEKFEDIQAWQAARVLTNLVYTVSSTGAFGRDFSLKNQIDRAAISVVSNIAEGYERDGDKEFIQFLSVAKASCGEVRAQLYLALDRKHISDEQFMQISGKAAEVSRMISGLIKYLRQSEFSGKKYK